MRVVIFHIDWPKTGTTTLQKHVFPIVKGYRYLGKTSNTKGNSVWDNMVYQLQYASNEKFNTSIERLIKSLQKQEIKLFGNIDSDIPLFLSEEAILSTLLKPSDHQHHGISTASLEVLITRLKQLETAWGVEFHFLISMRNSIEILHSYYAQIYHVFSKFKQINTFSKYINTGVSEDLNSDLGFRYLKDDYLFNSLTKSFPNRIFLINMKDLFLGDKVMLRKWYPMLENISFDQNLIENNRTIRIGTKVTHLRPSWVERKRLTISNLIQFSFRQLKQFVHRFKLQFFKHEKLEIHIELTNDEKEKLHKFFTRVIMK